MLNTINLNTKILQCNDHTLSQQKFKENDEKINVNLGIKNFTKNLN